MLIGQIGGGRGTVDGGQVAHEELRLERRPGGRSGDGVTPGTTGTVARAHLNDPGKWRGACPDQGLS